jgi:hypothetical protein
MFLLLLGQGFADKRKRKIKQEYRKLLMKEKKSGNELNDRRKHVSVMKELSEEATSSTDSAEAKQR